jgi:hypothetical protein
MGRFGYNIKNNTEGIEERGWEEGNKDRRKN